MALKTNSSFSDGFTQGFGLVANVKDRQLKRDQLTATQADSDRKFGLDQERVTNLKAFQDASIQNDAADNVLRAQTATITAENQRLIAQNQGIVAETNQVKTAIEKQKQDRLNDPNSLESQKFQSDIDDVKAGTAAKTDNLRASQDAVVLSTIYDSALGNSEYTDSDIKKFIDGASQLEGGRFDPANMVTKAGLESPKVIAGFMQQLAEGNEVDMSPEVLRAVSNGLNLGSSRSRGMVVDSSFKNAPANMQKGNYVVSEQGLLSGSAVRTRNPDGSFSDALSGTMYVKLADRDDPDNQVYYFPPTTENRSSTTATPLTLTMDEVAQTMAANSHMINSIGPAIRPLARLSKIQGEFGDNKGNNGVADFNTHVANILETNRKAIQNGGNVTSLMGMTAEHAALSREQMLDEGKMKIMKDLIEDQTLFGVPAEPEVAKVKRWLAETEKNLNLQQVPQSNGSATLASIVGDNWNPQLISNLNSFFDVKDGQTFITDEAALIAELKQLGYWN